MTTLDIIGVAYVGVVGVAVAVIARRTRELPADYIHETCVAPGCRKRPLLYESICDDCKAERTLFSRPQLKSGLRVE